MQENNKTTPTIEAIHKGIFNLYIDNPNKIASSIKRIDEVPAAGILVNVSATIIVKTAITSTRVAHANMRNNFFPLIPIYFSIINPIDFD